MAAGRIAVRVAATAAGGLLFCAATARAGQDMTPAFARGAEIAQARCSSCHAVALESASPVKIAPLFRVLARLYSAEDLETKLLNIARHGHFEMPPVQLREDEIADVAAYIAGLEGGDTEAAQGPQGRERPIARLGPRGSPAAAKVGS